MGTKRAIVPLGKHLKENSKAIFMPWGQHKGESTRDIDNDYWLWLLIVADKFEYQKEKEIA